MNKLERSARRLIDWFEKQAAICEKASECCSEFPHLHKAYLRDAKMYRVKADELRKALAAKDAR